MTKPIQVPLSSSSESQVLEGSPTREEIALRAYQIYCERGDTPGTDVEDWLQAEREVTEKRGKTSHMAKTAAV
jgi:hypothetical protein